MTEYDYSSDAVKQYLATQKRVSNWVDHTKRHVPSNPFAPSTCPSSPTKSEQSRGSKIHSSKSKSRRASDETCHPRDQTQFSSSPSLPGSESLRSYPSRHTESTYHPGSTTLTQPSSLTATSRHTRKSTNPHIYYQTVEAHKDRPTTLLRSEGNGYIINLNGGRSGVILVPPPGKRMEVWAGPGTHDQSSAMILKKSKDQKKI